MCQYTQTRFACHHKQLSLHAKCAGAQPDKNGFFGLHCPTGIKDSSSVRATDVAVYIHNRSKCARKECKWISPRAAEKLRSPEEVMTEKFQREMRTYVKKQRGFEDMFRSLIERIDMLWPSYISLGARYHCISLAGRQSERISHSTRHMMEVLFRPTQYSSASDKLFKQQWWSASMHAASALATTKNAGQMSEAQLKEAYHVIEGLLGVAIQRGVDAEETVRQMEVADAGNPPAGLTSRDLFLAGTQEILEFDVSQRPGGFELPAAVPTHPEDGWGPLVSDLTMGPLEDEEEADWIDGPETDESEETEADELAMDVFNLSSSTLEAARTLVSMSNSDNSPQSTSSGQRRVHHNADYVHTEQEAAALREWLQPGSIMREALVNESRAVPQQPQHRQQVQVAEVAPGAAPRFSFMDRPGNDGDLPDYVDEDEDEPEEYFRRPFVAVPSLPQRDVTRR
ncbi:MAG: hypothetical protein M4579_000435 [Chaenotheca gracillima]|nr:MAG: hypothetical protein M4579_000435 [Chaenotheca gracillima]